MGALRRQTSSPPSFPKKWPLTFAPSLVTLFKYFSFSFLVSSESRRGSEKKMKTEIQELKSFFAPLKQTQTKHLAGLECRNHINGDHYKARGARSDRNCLRNKFLAAPELKNGNILKKRTKKTRNASMEKDEPAQERSNLNIGKQPFLWSREEENQILCVWREEYEAQCTLGASIRMAENLFSTHRNLRCQLLPAPTIILIEGFRFYHCTFELRLHSSFMSLSSCGGMKWNWYDEKLLLALS